MIQKQQSETSSGTVWGKTQELGREAKDAGRHVWLAGLGAIHSVDHGSRELFSDLVARGRRFEARQRPMLEGRWREVGERVGAFRNQLEHAVENRLAHTLKRFGVPDRDDVHRLIDRVERLTRKVEGLTVTKS